MGKSAIMLVLKAFFWVLCFFTLVAMKDIDKIEANLRSHVVYLSEKIGQRSYYDTERLNKAVDYIEERFRSYKCAVKKQQFEAEGQTYYNIEAEVKGTSNADEIIVIGAHYDTVIGTPGADDNASGIAGVLELARLTAEKPLPYTIRFVAFALEEPPFFRTKHMGSYVYAESLKKENAKVKGMISLEMIGYFCDKEGCQFYPLSFFKWFYPKKGDYLAFVGNISSRAFTTKIKKAFKKASSFPIESINTISLVPGIDFSDHLSFWEFDYDAFMITDTSFYRNPHYHGAGDTPDILDYKRMAEFVEGFYSALEIYMKEEK